ncbi:MAG: 3-oxoacyl-ACP synthase III family protein [Bdellovibrionales bacterium]
MSSTIYSKIVSTGVYLPKKIVTNKDLEKVMDTSDEWIQQRSGIVERRWSSPGETMCSMSTAASQAALKNAGLEANDIDAIIYSSLLSDYIFPGTGCLLQESLGCEKTIPALDVRNQCSGFLYALSIADAWIRTGTYKRILIATCEIHNTSMDKSPAGRDTSVLFGDGAASVIVEASTDPKSCVMDITLASQGKYAKKLVLERPSPNDEARIHEKLLEDPKRYPYMDGKYVFKNAVERMTESMKEIAARNKVEVSDIDFVIPHQANKRIIQMVLEQLQIPENKTHYTLDRFGNTTSVTIPLTLHECLEQKKIKRGDLIAFTAFGSGFTWGSALVRF